MQVGATHVLRHVSNTGSIWGRTTHFHFLYVGAFRGGEMPLSLKESLITLVVLVIKYVPIIWNIDGFLDTIFVTSSSHNYLISPIHLGKCVTESYYDTAQPTC